MKHRLFPIISAVIFLLSILGCGLFKPNQSTEKQSDNNYPVTVCGVALESAPKSVIVLSPSLAEIISDMGFGSALIGRSRECDYPETVASLPAVGSVLIPDIDIIISLNPDILITQTRPSDTIVKLLDENKIKNIVIPVARRFDELQTVYTNVAQIFSGSQTGLSKGIAHMTALTDALRPVTDVATAAAGQTPLSAVYITDRNGHAATGDTVLHRLIIAAGADNAAGGDREWVPEKQSLLNADVIFCPEQIKEQIKGMSGLSGSPAVKSGRIYGLQAASMERQSKRMTDAVLKMAEKLYPEAFQKETSTTQTTFAN